MITNSSETTMRAMRTIRRAHRRLHFEVQQRALQPARHLASDQVADGQDDQRGQQFRPEFQREVDDGGADLLDGFGGRGHGNAPSGGMSGHCDRGAANAAPGNPAG